VDLGEPVMQYFVKRQGGDGVWRRVVGSQGNRSYATGWYHAMTSFIPRPAHQLLREDGKVIEEDEAHGGVTVNQGGQRPQ
jgi:hypothetical protein